MKPKNGIAILALFSLLLVVGCRTQEEAELDEPDDTAIGDLNPVEAQSMVDDVTIGKNVGVDGMIETEDQGDDFAPGETVYLTMNVADAAAGTAVKVTWYGPGEQEISEEEKTIAAGVKYLTFQFKQAPDKGSWGKGDYRAEVWVGDEKVNTQQFQIVDASEAGT